MWGFSMEPCAERTTTCDDVGRQEATMNEAELKQKTRDTAVKLFHTLKSGSGFEQWKKFDKQLARQLSMFFTGVLYSREVISQKQRELCAVASLPLLDRHNERPAHIHGALHV